ncbi:MAG: hypothetical protein AAF950_17170 [Pseudomonadota bacterium]
MTEPITNAQPKKNRASAQPKKTKRIQLVASPEAVAEIDAWRGKEKIWSRSEAIRRLWKIGLRAKKSVMADPITDAELDEWEHVLGNVQRALANYEPMDAPYCEKADLLEADALGELYRLLAEHRKMRAHIVDTIGEDGLREVLIDG